MDFLVVALGASIALTAYKDVMKAQTVDRVKACEKVVDIVYRNHSQSPGELFSLCYEKGPSAILVKKNLE